MRSSPPKVLVSVVSLIEISIKRRLGKIRFDLGQTEESLESIGAKLLPLTLPHVRAFDRVEPLHKDPFDRLLVSQAGTEGGCLLSSDSFISQYPIDILW